MWWLGVLFLAAIAWGLTSASRLLYPVPRTLTTSEATTRWTETMLRAPDGEDLPVWRLPVDRPHGRILLCHGYFANRFQVLGIANRLQQRGFEPVIMELRGHGVRPGPCGLGSREGEDACIVLKWMQQECRPAVPLGVLGFSMGATVVCQAAHRTPEVKAVVADSAYARLFPVLCLGLKQEYRLPGPVFGWITWWAVQAWLRRRLSAVDPARLAPAMRQPLLSIHGGADRRVPPPLGQAVYDRWAGPKERWEDPDAVHVGIFARDPARYADRVAEFFRARMV